MKSENDKNSTTELWLMLQELESDTLEPEKRDELMALVERSPAAQRAYLEYFEMTAMLEAEAATQSEKGKLPIMTSSQPSIRSIQSSVLAAVAVLILAAIVASLIAIKSPEPRQLIAVATADTQWMVDNSAQDPTANEWTVSSGSTVQVWSGTVKLRLESGAVMVMQGPARVSFPELETPVLKKGWLWIDSGKSGESFEVSTPELIVRDIGTRFGVRVPEKGPAEVHLIEGKVEFLAKSTKKVIATLEPEKRGVSITAVGKPARLALARDPFPKLAELLAAPGNYATTVRSQNPAGYWRMEEAAPGALDNEIPEGAIGRRHPQVRLGEPGPEPESGFHGFDRGNTSARLPAEPDDAPLLLGATPMHTGDLFRDDFDTPHDYTAGVSNTIWHGVVNAENAVSLDADTTTAGRLRMEAAISKGWDAGKNNAPFLYMNVSGDFDARVEVTAQTSGNYSAGALMARLGAPAANGDPGEDYMTVTSNRFGNNAVQARTLRDGAQNDSFGSSNAAFPRHLRLTRTGNTFRAFESANGTSWKPVSWGGMRGLPIGVDLVRDDLDGLPLQVGLWQGSFSTDIHTADFDNFSIRIASDPASLSVPRPGGASARVARKEGAVSFWMRREPGEERKEMLWAAGEYAADAAIHAHLTASGAVGFFMDDGRYDILITSKESIVDGQWHHVVANWSTSTMNLYVDGIKVAHTPESREMTKGILPELRFGNGAVDSGFAPFIGWVDEIALWDRPLTLAEVRHQFRSAKGKPDEKPHSLLPPEDK
jgi:ferric-dicitrate binding protein FerR (iron transport regulator)